MGNELFKIFMIKNLVHIRKSRFVELLITLVLFAGIIIAKDQPKDDILATVGKKKITVAEFKGRCEFTIRPDNFKDKSIALNNLIIEKILASEAEKNHVLASNPGYHARLKGIKEQEMREKLYVDVAFNKATVDTNRLKTAYKLSTREYELEFYRMHKELAQKVKAIIDSTPGNTNNLFKNLSEFTGKQPVHKIKYKDPDDDAIHEALFSKPLLVGDVVGPIELSTGEYLVMKVLNWTSYPLFSGEDQQEQWNNVRETEQRIKASKIWQSYQAEVMHGKKIEFEKNTFLKLADWVREKYISEQQKKVPSGNPIPEIPFAAIGLDLASPFFVFENKVWTVGDFRNELRSRPFLFRSKDLDSSNFNTQFKLAVIDIMTDHCLTREAYKKSLDKSEDVTQTVNMWSDSFLASNQQQNVVGTASKKGKIAENDALEILKYWESYVNNLQKQYRHSVNVNIPVYESVSLTKINMVAIKPRMPYPTLVPAFPTFISSETTKNGMQKE
jgi:hypothetical protein